MRIVAFVPAKSTSDRLPNKNQQILDGDPLYLRKILQLLACPSITEVYLDSDDPALYDAVSYLPVKFLHRPIHLASNATDGHELFTWECQQVPDADIYTQALCTAPFLGPKTIERAIQKLINSAALNSLVAVTHNQRYRWPENGCIFTGKIPNSNELPVEVDEAMCLYIVRSTALHWKHRYGADPLLFPITAWEAFDIHTQADLDQANLLVRGKKAEWFNRMQLILPRLSSAILSDIAHDLKQGLVLPSWLKGTKKMMGRVRTLKLTPWPYKAESIYQALDSYKFVGQHDIIVVDNIGAHEFAYFGEVNAHLAVRAGAQGAIIAGKTRDKEGVDKLGFPVYSMGYTCQDVKGQAYVKSMNGPIAIGSTTIQPDDSIFADSEGVVVLPKVLWDKEFCPRIIAVWKKERNILDAVVNGEPISEVLAKFGEF